MGGIFGGDGGAGKAAKIAAQTADKNNAVAQGMYDSNKALLQPTIDRGNAAGSAYNALLGLGGDSAAADQAFKTFQGSDGYQFRLNQGLAGVNAGAFARGGGLSGATLKGLNDYAGESASSEFAKYLGELQNPMQLGSSSISSLAGVGQNLVNNVTANNNSAGSAKANAAIAQAQSSSPFGILGSVLGGSSFGDAFNANAKQAVQYAAMFA